MDFSLTEEQVAIKAMASSFAKDNFLLLSKYLPKNRIDIIVKDVIVKFLMPSNDCRSII